MHPLAICWRLLKNKFVATSRILPKATRTKRQWPPCAKVVGPKPWQKASPRIIVHANEDRELRNPFAIKSNSLTKAKLPWCANFPVNWITIPIKQNLTLPFPEQSLSVDHPWDLESHPPWDDCIRLAVTMNPTLINILSFLLHHRERFPRTTMTRNNNNNNKQPLPIYHLLPDYTRRKSLVELPQEPYPHHIKVQRKEDTTKRRKSLPNEKRKSVEKKK